MMSTGLPWLQVAGNSRFKSAIVSSDNVGQLAAGRTRASVARTPAPPPLVRIASRSPTCSSRQCQCLGGIEQLSHRPDPQHPGAAKRGVVNGIGAGKHTGMRGRGAGAGIRSARLQHQNGLDARGRSRRGHEFAAMSDAFDIEQDGTGVRIRGEIVEHVAKIDIRHISQ